MERIAYFVKHNLPGVFPVIAYVGRVVTVLRFSRQRADALAEAPIQGEIAGQRAVMRPLSVEDADTLQGFIEAIPESHLEYFHPHGFGQADITAVLSSRSFMTYGLFVEDAIVAYALLKLAPTGTAFRGRMVTPEYAGKGVGRFISKYISWQASLAGLRARATVSRQNLASIKSIQAVTDFSVIAELPNDYMMIEFPKVGREPPLLAL